MIRWRHKYFIASPSFSVEKGRASKKSAFHLHTVMQFEDLNLFHLWVLEQTLMNVFSQKIANVQV